MNKSNHPSKIPIAITRTRKGGTVGKLESNLKRIDKQLKSKEPATIRTSRTIKKVPNFKKLHKQFEAHIARGKEKKKPATVFAEFPVTNKENVAQTQAGRHNDNKVCKQDEVTITSLPSVSMVTKFNKGQSKEEFMFRFKELCENYQTGYYRRPLPHRHVSKQNNSEQLPSDAEFKSLVEKAVYSQHHMCTKRHRPVASPGYTRGMQEASDALLRSVKRLYEPKCHYHQLDDIRANLAEQLDSCSDRVDRQYCSSRRDTILL